ASVRHSLTLDVFHGEHEPAVGPAVEVVHLGNARVTHAGDQQRFLSKSLLGARVVLTQGRTQHLHGAEAAQKDLLREVNGPHAAGSEAAQHAIPAAEYLADQVCS